MESKWYAKGQEILERRGDVQIRIARTEPTFGHISAAEADRNAQLIAAAPALEQIAIEARALGLAASDSGDVPEDVRAALLRLEKRAAAALALAR